MDRRPKGGTRAYREAWHHAAEPRQLYLTEKACGRSPYAAQPLRFVSI